MKPTQIDIDKSSKEKYNLLPFSEKDRLVRTYEQHCKSVIFYYVLLFLFGFSGMHQFYLDKNRIGTFYMFSIGLFGIGLLYDLATGAKQVKRYNEEVSKAIIDDIDAQLKRHPAIDTSSVDISSGLEKWY